MRIEDLAGIIEAVGFRSGTWFYIPDDAIFRRLDNKEFAWAKRNKTEDDTRPVLLGNPFNKPRPNVVVYPRSTNHQGENKPHDHREEFNGCRINKAGDVVLTVPCTISGDLVNWEYYSCEEPTKSDVMNILRHDYGY